jgi:hypothetical protein
VRAKLHSLTGKELAALGHEQLDVCSVNEA